MDLPTKASPSDLRSEQINKLLDDENFRIETAGRLAEESKKLEAECKNILDQIGDPNSEDKRNLLYASLFIHEDCLATVEQFKSNLELCELEGLTPDEEKKLEIALTEVFKLYNEQEQLWQSEDFRKGFLEGWHYAFRKGFIKNEEE